ncbi:hypothetical protein EST38_g8602 [Candolleomyces aberdarensis]|uniref:Uncharacterized protein n=1 Tax=Candolleomyces aberdarensis TaxID=2316362 RepID=A0A4Q2DE80_9AGAR|nr:hypothetical protein EST38_g8602 [Candolleomyces aberdarensis]
MYPILIPGQALIDGLVLSAVPATHGLAFVKSSELEEIQRVEEKEVAQDGASNCPEAAAGSERQ